VTSSAELLPFSRPADKTPSSLGGAAAFRALDARITFSLFSLRTPPPSTPLFFFCVLLFSRARRPLSSWSGNSLSLQLLGLCFFFPDLLKCSFFSSVLSFPLLLDQFFFTGFARLDLLLAEHSVFFGAGALFSKSFGSYSAAQTLLFPFPLMRVKVLFFFFSSQGAAPSPLGDEQRPFIQADSKLFSAKRWSLRTKTFLSLFPSLIWLPVCATWLVSKGFIVVGSSFFPQSRATVLSPIILSPTPTLLLFLSLVLPEMRTFILFLPSPFPRREDPLFSCQRPPLVPGDVLFLSFGVRSSPSFAHGRWSFFLCRALRSLFSPFLLTRSPSLPQGVDFPQPKKFPPQNGAPPFIVFLTRRSLSP